MPNFLLNFAMITVFRLTFLVSYTEQGCGSDLIRIPLIKDPDLDSVPNRVFRCELNIINGLKNYVET